MEEVFDSSVSSSKNSWMDLNFVVWIYLVLGVTMEIPHNLQAEQSVIGALLIDNAAYDSVADVVRTADFYTNNHREIYGEIVRLIERGEPVDAVTLGEKTGELAYLIGLHQNTPSAKNARHYARIVRDKATERRLLAAANEISGIAYQAGDIADKLASAEAELAKVTDSRQMGSVKSISDALTKAVENLDMRYHKGGVSGLQTGFSDLDELTAGLQPGDLIIVAGRPSMGKSALSDQIAEHAALHGHPALTFSLEMTDEQMATRRLSGMAKVPLQRLRTGRVEEEDWNRLTVGLGKLSDIPLFIDDTPNISASEIRAKSARMKREKGLSLIVVDYLQLMRGEGNSRHDEIAGISRSLKSIAKELHVPVIAVSQLSRKCEERGDKRPIMSDLRESGQIEQDADVIMFVYRDEVYNDQSPMKGTAEIIIGKQRMGPRDTVRLTFLGEYTRFENYTGPAMSQVIPMKRKRGFEYE